MQTACLLLHGLCGTPFEVSFIAKELTQRGIVVDSPPLPGHGTHIDDLKPLRFWNWLDFARKRYTDLAEQYSNVVVGGFSMGGTLATLLASEFSCSGLFCISAPAFIYRIFPWQMLDWKMPFMGLLQHIRPYPHFRKASKYSRALAPFEGYEGVFFTPQIYSFSQGTELLRQRLKHITCPSLIIHDLHDRLAFSESALLIAKGIASTNIKLMFTNVEEKITSHHMITTHAETRDIVTKASADFVDALAQN